MMTSVVNTSGTFDGIPVPLPFIYVTVGIRVARAKVRHSVAASSPTKERRRLRLVGQPAALWFLSFRGRSNLSCTVRSPPVQPLSSSSRRYVRRTFSTKRKPSKTLNGQRNGRTAGVRACVSDPPWAAPCSPRRTSQSFDSPKAPNQPKKARTRRERDRRVDGKDVMSKLCTGLGPRLLCLAPMECVCGCRCLQHGLQERRFKRLCLLLL